MANMEVSINDGSDWKAFIALSQALGEGLIKKYQIGRGSCFTLKEQLNFPGYNANRFLLVGFLAEVAHKKERFCRTESDIKSAEYGHVTKCHQA